MVVYFLRWVITLAVAFIAGKLMSKIKMPSILGWLIVGMLFGPHAIDLMPQEILDTGWYKIIIMWMQCAFGVMLGSELILKKLRSYGKALVITTLTQSLGTFAVVSLAFGLVFISMDVPIYLAFVFGGIALATAPAPALSIVNEFHAKGPVTDTLLPMTVLDDVVGIAVFFTVNSLVAREASGGAVPLYMIPVMIFLPVVIGLVVGFPTGMLLKKENKKAGTLVVLLFGITVTMLIGWMINSFLLSGITLNYMLMGVSFAAVFSNIVTEERLSEISDYFSPILGICLLAAIVDLGAPLDYHLILGAGLYTIIYILARAFGKYFGAMAGARITHMPDTVRKYLGLTLLPHSGVSLVFTGIICTTLSSSPQLVQLVQGTIAAAAVINEFIAVIAAKKGFELAKEI
ncbi:MAG: cation:proton antiporter [Roseburia sp.]|uniref:cation:proton antiporter domain-containing protein n=1 Tax=Roseburia hominis TaxID=301301 RepID=UPI001F328866|nr:cation:proton antiporter [Roseburia hominis]MDY4839352.1 cation:proton antiporter [Lachnospiraceae bacterium]